MNILGWSCNGLRARLALLVLVLGLVMGLHAIVPAHADAKITICVIAPWQCGGQGQGDGGGGGGGGHGSGGPTSDDPGDPSGEPTTDDSDDPSGGSTTTTDDPYGTSGGSTTTTDDPYGTSGGGTGGGTGEAGTGGGNTGSGDTGSGDIGSENTGSGAATGATVDTSDPFPPEVDTTDPFPPEDSLEADAISGAALYVDPNAPCALEYAALELAPLGTRAASDAFSAYVACTQRFYGTAIMGMADPTGHGPAALPGTVAARQATQASRQVRAAGVQARAAVQAAMKAAKKRRTQVVAPKASVRRPAQAKPPHKRRAKKRRG